MKVETTRFGVLEIDDSSVVKMPSGPLGFEEQTTFCLIQHSPDTSFRWLQSVHEPSLAFVVVDPAEFFEDYAIEISDADSEKLELESEGEALVLVVLTVGAEGRQVTANLAAPIVVNSRTLVGLQVVLQDERYGVKHVLASQDKKPSAESTLTKAA